jgi:hypothetical protein
MYYLVLSFINTLRANKSRFASKAILCKLPTSWQFVCFYYINTLQRSESACARRNSFIRLIFAKSAKTSPYFALFLFFPKSKTNFLGALFNKA